MKRMPRVKKKFIHNACFFKAIIQTKTKDERYSTSPSIESALQIYTWRKDAQISL